MKMIDRISAKKVGTIVLALACLLPVTAGISYGADYYLQAGVTTIPAGTFNNPADITMWGFASCTDDTFTTCDPVTVPGPELSATEGDPLNITVNNALSGSFTEPTSVIIPGQPGGNLMPTWTDDSTGNRTDLSQRVRSFTAETAVGGMTTYSWPSVKAGTYLYQSGTHPAVQVQMGLYGVLKVYAVAPVAPATSGQAYGDPSSAFDSEATFLFSEIDPVLHDAVATGNYGPGMSVTSTVEYHPRYFLINGQAATPSSVPTIPGGAAGENLLIRFLNAGFDTKVPVVQGPYMSIIALDGNFMTAVDTSGTVIPAVEQMYSALLPAGKTMDAILIPAAAGDIPVYDRRLNLSNAGQTPGGALAFLSIGQPLGPPVVDIKVNGSDGPISISTGVNAVVTISLDPGNLAGPPPANVDVFALARNLTTGDRYWWTGGQTWVQQISPIASSISGPIASIVMMEIWNTTLPVGTWRFYFGIDTVYNGSLNQGAAIIDTVRVNSVLP